MGSFLFKLSRHRLHLLAGQFQLYDKFWVSDFLCEVTSFPTFADRHSLRAKSDDIGADVVGWNSAQRAKDMGIEDRKGHDGV